MIMRLLCVVVLACVMFSCKQSVKETGVVNLEDIDLSESKHRLNELDTVGTGIPIFYNMYLSVELSSLFETAGTVFDKGILNSVNNTSQYLTSYKKAMNLGVYAVDLSYCRAFEQFDVAGRYFSSMQALSEQLGIPQDYFDNTAQRFERNMTNKDSLITIANEIYYETEEYLKENERFATASVIIMGGWVEALYIGTKVALESKNPDIIERIVDQKYSLNNLLILLKDYEDNELISDHISRLKELRILFNQLNISSDFSETESKAKKQMDERLVDIKKLHENILEIRKAIVE